MPQARFAPTRSLPDRPHLEQLRNQAKELLKSYRAGDLAAVAEVERFERRPNVASFKLADAQRVLARAYGFASWARLKQRVEGLTCEAFLAAAEAGDIAAVRQLATARPDLVRAHVAEYHGDALHRAVLRRDPGMVRALMELGADAHTGIWPHRDATSAYTIAKDRQYHEIVAIIDEEETRRRREFSPPGAAIDSRTTEIFAAIRGGRIDEAIAILQSDLSLVRSCDVDGRTPLHAAASAHQSELVAWLLDHYALPDARDCAGRSPLDDAASSAGWSANARYFPYLPNALVDPAQFAAVVELLRSHGAEFTPRAAVAVGDRDVVLQLHRQGRLTNDINFWGGGLLTIAVRVNRLDMVDLLLELGFDPDESAAATDDGGESWGFPLWFAAVCGRYQIAELLLTRGADPNAIFAASGDPLGNAVTTGDTKMQDLLLKHGARITVERVASAGDTHTAKQILQGIVPGHSLNVDQPSLVDLAEQMLWMAALSGKPDIVRLCLPHITRARDDPWWNYVLVHAATPETFELVLGHGIDPDVAGERGYTILHHVASQYVRDQNRVPFATMLLDAGASLDKRDLLLQSTPLGWACRWGRAELVRLYLDRGASAVEPDAEPWATPLAWATKNGHEEIVALLNSCEATQ